MTVAELIEELRQIEDQNAVVVLATVHPEQGNPWDNASHVGMLNDGSVVID